MERSDTHHPKPNEKRWVLLRSTHPTLMRNAISAAALILRFPCPSEVKTSPKSWRQLSLLDLAGRVSMDALTKRRHQPHGDKRRFSAGSFSYLSLQACGRNRAAGYRDGLGHSDHRVANPQDKYCGCNGDSDRHRHSIDRKSGGTGCEREGLVGRQTCTSAWRRSVDINHSVNRRHSGFADDDNGRAGAQRNCCGG